MNKKTKIQNKKRNGIIKKKAVEEGRCKKKKIEESNTTFEINNERREEIKSKYATITI